MDIYALDESFNLVTMGIPYDNLQWLRKYYDAGQFAMQVPTEVYDPSWKYIGTSERRELGMVQRIESRSDETVLISGFFCEYMLNLKSVYPRLTKDYATVEAAANDLFDRYKKDLPIYKGQSALTNADVSLDVCDDKLGSKLFSFLETYEMSYRVVYDYANNRLSFEIWKGKDRTQSQDENPYQVFSTEFANLKSRTVVTDDSDYYNYAICPADADEDGIEREVIYVDLSNGGFKREIVIDFRSSSVSDDQTMQMWRDSVTQEATERLLSFSKVEDIDIEPMGDMGYMEDFDLGDRVDVILTDVGIEIETRIIEVTEVFKADGGHSVTVGVGNKRISNIRRAMR